MCCRGGCYLEGLGFLSLMSVGTLAAYLCFHLGRCRMVLTRDVGFLLGLGLYLLGLTRILLLLGTSTEGNASTHYDGIYVVSTEHIHVIKGKVKTENGKVSVSFLFSDFSFQFSVFSFINGGTNARQ